MSKLEGRVETVDSIAYVPQQAWIQNASVKNNVLFGQGMDWARYNEIVRCRHAGVLCVSMCAGVGVCAGRGSVDSAGRGRDGDWREGHQPERRAEAAREVRVAT